MEDDCIRRTLFSVYILTNFNRTVLYIGVTKDLLLRREQHEMGAKSGGKGFTARYKCFYIVYYEDFQWIQDAILREKQLKHWPRKRTEELITAFNPEWKFLTDKDIGL